MTNEIEHKRAGFGLRGWTLGLLILFMALLVASGASYKAKAAELTLADTADIVRGVDNNGYFVDVENITIDACAGEIHSEITTYKGLSYRRTWPEQITVMAVQYEHVYDHSRHVKPEMTVLANGALEVKALGNLYSSATDVGITPLEKMFEDARCVDTEVVDILDGTLGDWIMASYDAAAAKIRIYTTEYGENDETLELGSQYLKVMASVETNTSVLYAAILRMRRGT